MKRKSIYNLQRDGDQAFYTNIVKDSIGCFCFPYFLIQDVFSLFILSISGPICSTFLGFVSCFLYSVLLLSPPIFPGAYG